MKTNQINEMAIHAIPQADWNTSYPVSFKENSLESQKNQFHKGKLPSFYRSRLKT
ncbi:hypothetical protein [Rossellomorea marisflavi]|uniref:hypothetical protein n=1 Tax=Rossellomorea marisflavi TaxID=189381 RepID=UPI003FA135C8